MSIIYGIGLAIGMMIGVAVLFALFLRPLLYTVSRLASFAFWMLSLPFRAIGFCRRLRQKDPRNEFEDIYGSYTR